METITEDYVSFETAKLLKEKGFDEESWCAYDLVTEKFAREIVDWNFRYNHGLPNYVASAPTLQMAMKWLREIHKIGVFPTTFYRHTKEFDGHNYGCTIVNLETFEVIGNFENCTFPADSYEQTCEAAIKYCLENLI